ncbi:MAG: hypothetical protein AAF416_18170 [Pseudomonadota bacterium]
MQLYSFFICDEAEGRELGGGYIRARNAREARRMLPFSDALISPAREKTWPEGAKGAVAWAYRSPELRVN